MDSSASAQSMGGLLGGDSHKAPWCCQRMVPDPWRLGSLILHSPLLVTPSIFLLFRILLCSVQVEEVFLSWRMVCEING